VARRKAEAARLRASFPAIDKAIDTVLTGSTSRPSDLFPKIGAKRFDTLVTETTRTT